MEARDRTHNLAVPGRIRLRCATRRTPHLLSNVCLLRFRERKEAGLAWCPSLSEIVNSFSDTMSYSDLFPIFSVLFFVCLSFTLSRTHRHMKNLRGIDVILPVFHPKWKL